MSESTVESTARVVVDWTEKTPIRVLHMDDEAGFLKVAQQLLEMQGMFEVDTALSVKEATEKMKKKTYDAVVSDYMMPEKDGLQFLKELRKKGNNIPFVMFTGRGREEVAIKALNLGADGYINKVGGPETVYGELAHSIRQAVKTRRVEAELRRERDFNMTLVQASPVFFVAISADGKTLMINKTFLRALGYTKAEVVGRDYLSTFVPEADREMLSEVFEKLVRLKESTLNENRVLTKDGRELLVEWHGRSILKANGELDYFFGVGIDITERKQMEEALRESEEKYRIVFENTGAATCIVEEDKTVSFVNKQFEKLSGYSKKEIEGKKKWTEFVTKECLQRMKKHHVERRKKGGKAPKQYTFDFINRKGEIRNILLTIDVIPEAKKSVASLVDITERKKAEEAVKGAEREKEAILDSLVELVAHEDLTMKILWANQAACKSAGLARKELVGRHCYEVWPKRKTPCPDCPVMKAMKTGKPQEIEKMTPDGRCWFIRGYPVLDVNGEVTGVIEVTLEITERKQMEQKLDESSSRLDLILSTIEEGVDIVSYDYVIRYQNKFLKDKFGDLTGKKCYVEYMGLKKPCPSCPMRKAIKYKKPFKTELTGKDGREYEIISMPLEQPDGHVDALEIVRDITERKKAETRVTQSEQKYRSLVEMAPDGVATADMKGVITSVNTAFARLTGYSKDEIVGKHFAKLQTIRARDIPKFLKLMGPALRGKKIPPFEYPYVRKDGTIRWGEAHIGRLKKDGKTIGFQAVLREVTERKQAEKATRESQEKFEQLFMGNPEAAVYVDPDFHVLDVNPRFTELFGYSLDEIQGKHINKVVVPEDKMLEAEGLDNKALKGYVYRDTIRKRKDGSLVPVSISAAPIVVDGRRVGQVGTYKDISQLKSVEKALRETMIKLAMMNEKLCVVGRLTRHDVRNKLSAVTANTYLMKKRLEGDNEAVERLSDIESAVRETTRIFDFARTYEKLGVEKLVYMDVEKTFDGAVQQFSDLQVKVVNDCSVLSVLADSLLTRLFYNLVHNSLMRGENVSKIRVYYEEAGQNQLKLVYEDDGVGIPKAEKEKIFREGYGKGTGYGLYLIKKMCEVYGWTIRETGKHGKGARFTMTIPGTNSSGKACYRVSRNR